MVFWRSPGPWFWAFGLLASSGKKRFDRVVIACSSIQAPFQASVLGQRNTQGSNFRYSGGDTVTNPGPRVKHPSPGAIDEILGRRSAIWLS